MSSISLNTTHTLNFEDEEEKEMSWYSEEDYDDEGFSFDEEDESEFEDYEDGGSDTTLPIVNNGEEEDEFDEFDEEVNSANFIMNQKSLVDKAPGALQHSFAHRTIPLEPNSFHLRLFQFISIFVMCSMTGGIPFGLPALRQLLVDLGIYECPFGTHDVPKDDTYKMLGCSTQEGKLAVLQNSGWVSWMIGGWLAARSVQHLGPRLTGMIGSSCILVGSLVLAISLPVDGKYWISPPWARLYLAPTVVMSVGSSFCFLASLHYVRLFPKRTSLLHSIVFLAQDLSALLFYSIYEARELVSVRAALLIYAAILFGQILFWRFVYPIDKIPTIRFTVTLWHQRPLLVDQSLYKHITSPYFYMAFLFSGMVFLKIFFYMSTFQVQLRLLLIPTKRPFNPEDFSYGHMENSFDETNGTPIVGLQPDNLLLQQYQEQQRKIQLFSHVPFFAEQPGGTSSNNLLLRQFIYNPMQPEIFLTDLQEMLYFLIPIAASITIFWMRSAMSDRKISTALLFSLLALVAWGFVQ